MRHAERSHKKLTLNLQDTDLRERALLVEAVEDRLRRRESEAMDSVTVCYLCSEGIVVDEFSWEKAESYEPCADVEGAFGR